MNLFTQSTSLMGIVRNVDATNQCFTIETRANNQFRASVGAETTFGVLNNIDDVNQDRYTNPENFNGSPSSNIEKYIKVGQLVSLYGIVLLNGSQRQFDVRNVYLLQDSNGEFVFEHSYWWLRQIGSFSDTWLKDLFGTSQTFDFSKYQTNIGITGMPIEDNTVQECATLSRLIYGFSSSYLLTGNNRYLDAAKSGVEYQRNNFRFITHNGKNIIWASAADKGKLIIPSQNGDDAGAIPLYEQIYALAGLAQYYRVTQDWETLNDIRMTVNAFNAYFRDEKDGGYFSHLDPATFTADTDYLGINKLKKNWNSIGDHIPAYLVNVILALEPLPVSEDRAKYADILDTLKEMLFECTSLVISKFPDADPEIPYVNERFYQDWTPDQTYSWQQNRAVCGHNLKISWNLLRVANYYDSIGKDSEPLLELAKTLADHLAVLGIDQIRGGLFDTVERKPKNGEWIDFAWGNTKDFWQQEQALLAYLINYGYFKEDEYLSLAREMASFWNLHYLDHDNGGFFFRVTEDGNPVLNGSFADKGGHAISGYHAFELNYLAHVYTSNYVSQKPMCLHFKPQHNGVRSINVLPDFMAPKAVKVSGIWVNGIEKNVADPYNYQILLNDSEVGSEIVVELSPVIIQKEVSVNSAIAEFTDTIVGKVDEAKVEIYSDTVGTPIKGKIAVLMESQFEYHELVHFNSFFPEQGYQVEYVSYLWGQDALTFYASPNDEGEVKAKIVVARDFKDVEPEDYQAVILMGAFAMDRLRYQVSVSPKQVNNAPALQFLRKSVQVEGLKIGAICHSLWLYCADKALLEGKKVTCAHNIICDVENAGGIVQFKDEDTVDCVVDGNLVTGRHTGVIDVFLNTLVKEIQLAQEVTV